MAEARTLLPDLAPRSLEEIEEEDAELESFLAWREERAEGEARSVRQRVAAQPPPVHLVCRG